MFQQNKAISFKQQKIICCSSNTSSHNLSVNIAISKISWMMTPGKCSLFSVKITRQNQHTWPSSGVPFGNFLQLGFLWLPWQSKVEECVDRAHFLSYSIESCIWKMHFQLMCLVKLGSICIVDLGFFHHFFRIPSSLPMLDRQPEFLHRSNFI